MKKGKKHQEASKKIDNTKRYPVDEAVKLLKDTAIAKFDGTVEIALKLNLDPRKADQNLRGAFVLPHGTGKVSRVLVFAEGENATKAKEAGADYVGADDFIKQIQDGWLDFDVIVATPDMMPRIGKLGRVLGPRGLMPNPKTGTVTQDVVGAINDIKAGKVEYRVDKYGNIHAAIGKVSFDNNKLEENIKSLTNHIKTLRPSTVKGMFIKNLSISSTMSPGIKVDFNWDR